MPIDIETCPSLTLLTSAETAKLLRLSNVSIRRYALDGRLRAVPGVGKLLFTAEAVRAFLKGSAPLPRMRTKTRRSAAMPRPRPTLPAGPQ